MKITKSQLKQIIKEYTKEYRAQAAELGLPSGQDPEIGYEPDERYMPSQQRLNKAGFSRDFFDAPTIVDDSYYERAIGLDKDGEFDVPDDEDQWTEDQRNLIYAFWQRNEIKHPLDPKYEDNWEPRGMTADGSPLFADQEGEIFQRNDAFFEGGPEAVGYWDAQHAYKPEEKYAFTSNKDRIIKTSKDKSAYMKGYKRYQGEQLDVQRQERAPELPAEKDPTLAPGPYKPGQAPKIPTEINEIKITKSQLRQIIKEELKYTLQESDKVNRALIETLIEDTMLATEHMHAGDLMGALEKLKEVITELERITMPDSGLEETRGVIRHRDRDERIPANHWTVKKGKCKEGETVKDCMKRRPWSK